MLLAERLPLLPPLRWRLAEVPLGLDYPYWVDDVDFDLDFHVRELALPAPGSDEQLAEQVARIVSRPLDRARPLWELYLIHGLESGYTAMLTKIHHAVIDGMSGAEIMGLLLDLAPEGRELPAGHRRPRPTIRRASWRCSRAGCLGLPRYPLRALRSLPAAVPNLDETPFGTLPGAAALGPARRRSRARWCAATAPGRADAATAPPRRRSTGASRRTGASSSASCRSTRSRRSRTRTARRSTTWSSRSAPAPCAAG